MKGIILRIVKQMSNDKRTLALMMIAPVLILCLLYLLLGDSNYQPKIYTGAGFPTILTANLEKQNVAVLPLETGDDGAALLKNHTADAIITMDGAGFHVLMLEMDSVKMAKITQSFKEAVTAMLPIGNIEVKYLYGNSAGSAFNSLGYVLLGVLSFFFVFIISGITFVRERENGTLERMMTTPVHRWEVVSGYTLGFGVFAALQSIIITLFTKYVLGLEIAGSVLLAASIMILLSFAAVSAGAFVSIFANNEFQVMQFIPVVIIPQIFFSGLLPIDTLPYGLGVLAYIMPVYYGCTCLKGVLVMGSGLGDLIGYLSILLGFTLFFFLLNVLALKKYRRL